MKRGLIGGSLVAALGGHYFSTRPSLISNRHRAEARTARPSVGPIAVHSRVLWPTLGGSFGSKAYIDHGTDKRGSQAGLPMNQPTSRVHLVELRTGGF